MPTYPPAVFLMGPTASGKTELAVELVRRLPLEIISVDSAMVYRGLDIGTAKPNPAVRAEAPHRLIDVADPAEPYSAARFRRDALEAMAEVTAAGRVPLLVGGTMLYYRALEHGLSPLPAADNACRARLQAEARARGWEALHQRLTDVDPVAGRRIHPNDPQRILRALEVHELTGRPLTELWREPPEAVLPYRLHKLVMAPPREALRERIGARFAAMLAAGLVAEVEGLRARGDLDRDLPAMRAVGYRQVWDHLEGRFDHDTMVRRAVTATRQLAKRQMTWLRREHNAGWFEQTGEATVSRITTMLEGLFA